MSDKNFKQKRHPKTRQPIDVAETRLTTQFKYMSMYAIEPTAHLDLHKIARKTMMRLQPARIEPRSMSLWTIASFCRQKCPRRCSLSRLPLNRGLVYQRQQMHICAHRTLSAAEQRQPLRRQRRCCKTVTSNA